MAFAAPAAVFLDENLPIHRGKRADGLNVKPLKPSARKALRDVSNTSKPPIPSIKGTALNDRSVLKDKSALRNQETIKKNPVNKTTIFADHEWAKGGVEGTHFTGNDAQKLDKDKLDERVKKEVEKVNSALSSALDDWTYVIFDHLLFPAKAVAPFYEVNVLELEPEIFPEITSTRLSTSGDLAEMAEDCFGEAEHDNCPFLENKPVEFQLRDDLEWMD